MRQFWRDVWWRLIHRPGCPNHPGLEDLIPDDIGVTGPWEGHWYLTATWGTGDDHHHTEIKLDKTRLRQLRDSIQDVD